MGAAITFNPTSIGAPGAGSSTMTITVLRLAQPGTFPITVTGSGGGIQQTTTVTLNIIPTQDYELSVSPGVLTLMQSTQGNSTVTSVVSEIGRASCRERV